MTIPVKIEEFEGPLDLLLHLIEKNKVDIYDIPIVKITDQYLDYINNIQIPDMNIISEFLVMAAMLVNIKCKMLLPKDKESKEDESEEADPREELVKRLLEYKQFKLISLELQDRQIDAQKNFYRSKNIPREVREYTPDIDYNELIPEDMNLEKLHEIFKFVMLRKENRIDKIRGQYKNIQRDEVDMRKKAKYIESYAISHKTFSFRGLLEKQRNKMETIVTFLVILEFMKVGKIKIYQENTFDDIVITSNIA